MATEQEYDDIIAPMLADVARRCDELGMNLIARVEWEPGESGITSMGIGDAASIGQRLTRLAAHAHGNIDKLLFSCLKHFDCRASILLKSYAKERAN